MVQRSGLFTTMGKVSQNYKGKPLTDVNIAIVCRTILAATLTSIIPARAANELLKVVPSRYLSFFSKSFLLFFLFLIHVNVGNVLSVLIQKVQWIESKRNWEKPLLTLHGP